MKRERTSANSILKVLAEMSYIGENTKSDKVRESLIHFLAFTYVEGNGVGEHHRSAESVL